MKRLVVKVGTGNLVNLGGVISQEKVADICRQVATLISRGTEVILVSSGSIKAGKDRMNAIRKTPNLTKKEWAGVGARHLLNLWGNSFEPYGIEIAQVWLTYANWTHQNEYQSIKASILAFLKSNIIPVVNENDVVSDREIVFMDQGISENDRLARMVAEMIEADSVLFLTDIGGIYDRDPRGDSSARRYLTVGKEVFSDVQRMNSKSDHGTGGVSTKLREAFICFEKGMKVAIAGLEEDVILRFAEGKQVGTSVGEVSVL